MKGSHPVHNANSVDENSNNNNMTHNDTHGLSSNISASQNDSDISMADIEGSQPLEHINEEGSLWSRMLIHLDFVPLCRISFEKVIAELVSLTHKILALCACSAKNSRVMRAILTTGRR